MSNSLFSICLFFLIAVLAMAEENKFTLELTQVKKQYFSGEVVSFTLGVEKSITIQPGHVFYLTPTSSQILSIEVGQTCKTTPAKEEEAVSLFSIAYDATEQRYLFTAVESVSEAFHCTFPASLFFVSPTSVEYDNADKYSLHVSGLGLLPTTLDWSKKIVPGTVSFSHVNATMNADKYDGVDVIEDGNVYTVQIKTMSHTQSLAGKTIPFFDHSTNYITSNEMNISNGSPSALAYTYTESECVTDDGVVVGDVYGQVYSLSVSFFRLHSSYFLTYRDTDLTKNSSIVACNAKIKFKPYPLLNKDGADVLVLNTHITSIHYVDKFKNGDVFTPFVTLYKDPTMPDELYFTPSPPAKPQFPPGFVYPHIASDASKFITTHSSADAQLMTSKEFAAYAKKHKDNETKKAVVVTYVTSETPVTSIVLSRAKLVKVFVDYSSDLTVHLAVREDGVVTNIEHQLRILPTNDQKGTQYEISPVYPRQFSGKITLYLRLSSFSDILPYQVDWYVGTKSVYSAITYGAVGSAVVVDVPKVSSNLVRPDLYSPLYSYKDTSVLTLQNAKANTKDISFMSPSNSPLVGKQLPHSIESPSLSEVDFNQKMLFNDEYIVSADKEITMSARLNDGQCFSKIQFKTRVLSYDASRLLEFSLSTEDGTKIDDKLIDVSKNKLFFVMKAYFYDYKSEETTSLDVDFQYVPLSFVQCKFLGNTCPKCKATSSKPHHLKIDYLTDKKSDSTNFYSTVKAVCEFAILPEQEMTGDYSGVMLASLKSVTPIGEKTSHHSQSYLFNSASLHKRVPSASAASVHSALVVTEPSVASPHSDLEIVNTPPILNAETVTYQTFTYEISVYAFNAMNFKTLVPLFYSVYTDYHHLTSVDIKVTSYVPYEFTTSSIMNITFTVVDEMMSTEEQLRHITSKFLQAMKEKHDIESDKVLKSKLTISTDVPENYKPTCSPRYVNIGGPCETDSDCSSKKCGINKCVFPNEQEDDDDGNSSTQFTTHVSVFLVVLMMLTFF